MDVGIPYDALMAGFALPFIAAFVLALPYVAIHVFRRLVDV